MSRRRLIVAAMKTILEADSSIKYVTRKLLRLRDLRDDQIPAVSLLGGFENDPEGESTAEEKQGIWDFHLLLYVKDLTSGDPAGALDDLLALIARLFAANPTLNGTCDDIELVSRDSDRGIFDPFASSDMIFRISYFFNRITEGG